MSAIIGVYIDDERAYALESWMPDSIFGGPPAATQVANNVAFLRGENDIVSAVHYDDESSLDGCENACFPSFGKYLRVLNSPDLAKLGLEQVVTRVIADVKCDAQNGFALVLPHLYSGDTYRVIKEILTASGLVYRGVLDDRSALCLYLLEGVQELRRRLENSGKMQLIVVDAIGKEWIVSPVDLELKGTNVTVVVQNIVKKQVATGKLLADEKKLTEKVDSIVLGLCDEYMEQAQPSIAIFGSESITTKFRDSAVRYFGDSMREAGALVCISSELTPYAGAAGVFASRFDSGSRDGAHDVGFSYGFVKKYVFGIRTGDESVESLIDLRGVVTADISSLERSRLFHVNDATRDIVVDLRAGYASSVESTFSVERVTLVKDEHFRGTEIDFIVTVKFANPMQGEFVCHALDKSFSVSKGFQIEF